MTLHLANTAKAERVRLNVSLGWEENVDPEWTKFVQTWLSRDFDEELKKELFHIKLDERPRL